jgi:hypothetical protein
MVNAPVGGAVSRPGILALALCALVAPWTVRAQTASKRAGKPSPAAAPAPKKEAKPPPAQAPASTEWVPPPNEADIALLRALLYALEPAPQEIRIIAAEDLALLGDPRALDVLAHLVFDRDPQVARAAVHAVTRFRHPRAEQMLANIIHHPALPDALKTIAVEGVQFQDASRSRQLLKEIVLSTTFSAAVRTAARITLERIGAADSVTTR